MLEPPVEMLTVLFDLIVEALLATEPSVAILVPPCEMLVAWSEPWTDPRLALVYLPSSPMAILVPPWTMLEVWAESLTVPRLASWLTPIAILVPPLVMLATSPAAVSLAVTIPWLAVLF